MPCSEAQQLANRANALKSTGPTSDEGKEISRQNSFKHGLTGGGVVIPGEDLAEVADRVEALQTQLAPAGDPASRLLAARLAMLTVRVERSARHEIAMTAERVRNAADDYDEARRTSADHWIGYIGAEPATHHRRLMNTPEGIDLLLKEMHKFCDAATPGVTYQWSDHHGNMYDSLTGVRPGRSPVSRCSILTDALVFNRYEELDVSEYLHLDPKGRFDYATGELVKLISAEINRLEAHKATLDVARIALSRAEAGERALVDTSPAAVLARKYEAATERAIFRTLEELRVIRRESQTDRTDPPPAAVDPSAFPELDELSPALGSFLPGTRASSRPTYPAPVTLSDPVTEVVKSRSDRQKRPTLPT